METFVEYVVGSHSYNLANRNSDFDTLTVFLLEPHEMFGLERVKLASQKVFGNTDKSAVEFSEYLRRLVAGNPTYVQTLYSWDVNVAVLLAPNYRKFFRDSLLMCLVAENVHRSFTGVATRMFHEYEQKGSNKALSESFRYLFVLSELLQNGSVEVFLSGGNREYFAALREVGSNDKRVKEKFVAARAECDLLLKNTKFGYKPDDAFKNANNLSILVYGDYFQ